MHSRQLFACKVVSIILTTNAYYNFIVVEFFERPQVMQKIRSICEFFKNPGKILLDVIFAFKGIAVMPALQIAKKYYYKFQDNFSIASATFAPLESPW